MKSIREEFEENYIAEQHPCSNRQGFRIRYRYIGFWYIWELEPKALRQRKRRMGALCALSLLCFLGAALQDCELNYGGFPQLWAMFSLAAYLFELIGVVQFCLAKNAMTRFFFTDMDRKLRIAVLLHAGFLGITAVSCIGVILAEGLPFALVGTAALYAAAGVFSAQLYRVYRSIPYRKSKPVTCTAEGPRMYTRERN